MNKNKAVFGDIDKDRSEIAEAAKRLATRFADHSLSNDEISAVQLLLDIHPNDWDEDGLEESVSIVDSDEETSAHVPPKVIHRSARNMYMKWDRMMRVLPEIVISAAAASSAPLWLLPFIALHIAVRVHDHSDQEFSPEHATVLVALWRKRDRHGSIDEEEGYVETCELLEKFGLKSLTKGEYVDVMDIFSELSIIQIIYGRIYFSVDDCAYVKHSALNL